MRRKEKFMVGGALIGFGAVSAFDILSQWLDHLNRGVPFTWASYDCKRTLKRGLLYGALPGLGIGYLTYKLRLSDEAKYPFNSDEHLKKTLSSQNLKNHPALFQNILMHRNHVKEVLSTKFGDRLAAPPEDIGSFFKRTAIISSSDLDIVLPFKRSAYSTLEEMYNDVSNTLGKRFGDNATVIKRTRAIEVTFGTDENAVSFDIVPGREISDYKTDKDLNLYVRPDWAWQKGSSFKTNIRLQKRITTNMPEARRVIRLLKLYRDQNGFDLRSPIIEQAVVEALSGKYGVYYSDTENLLNSMSHLARKLRQKTIVDHANTNNNLIENMSALDKTHIVSLLYTDIGKIEQNPSYLREIFE